MIRKGLRPGFRIALDTGNSGHAYRRVMPFRKSWLAIGILLVFDLIFLIPAVTTFQQAATEWGKFDDLFDLVSALFLTGWLLGWSIAPLLMTTILAMMLFGREVIRVSPGKLELFLGLPGVGVVATYDVTKMRNLCFERPPKKSGKSWRGPHIAFDYAANTGAFGSNLTEFDVSEIKGNIERASGHSIRVGRARPIELEGEWEPEVILAEATPPEPLLAEASISTEPVTITSLSTITLVIANLVPLTGAVFLGWDLGNVMVLYWAESAVIGFFNILKIIVIGRWLALLAGPFFVGHFGAFMAVHFLFIYGIFVQGMQDNSGGDLTEVAAMFVNLWPALAVLFASHAFSFIANFLGRKEYRGRSVQTQMSEPYSRIILMHLVLILGGGLTLVLGEAMPVLFLVIVLKIVADVKAHLKQRSSQ